MANTFKSFGAEVTSTLTAVYTVPSETTSVVVGCQAANTGAGNGWVSLGWERSGVTTFLAWQITVPEGAAWDLVAGKVVLEPGDVLKAQAQSDVQLTVSLLEVSS